MRFGCSSTTKKGRVCPIPADRQHEGRWYCHVHDPQGVFQRQQAAKVERRERRAAATPPDATERGIGYQQAMADLHTLLAMAKVTHPANPWREAVEHLLRRHPPS